MIDDPRGAELERAGRDAHLGTRCFCCVECREAVGGTRRICAIVERVVARRVAVLERVLVSGNLDDLTLVVRQVYWGQRAGGRSADRKKNSV